MCGVYWALIPGYTEVNAGHDRPLPRWFWSGDTGMACLSAAIGQSLQQAYAPPYPAPDGDRQLRVAGRARPA